MRTRHKTTGARPSIRMVVFLQLALAVSILAWGGTAHAIDLDLFQIHGYLDLEYSQSTKNEGQVSSDAADPTNGAFDIRHFNLLTDFLIMPEFSVRSHIEFDHGGDTELGRGDIILEYAFGEYLISNDLKIRGGKTLTPFGLYNEIHDASPAFLTVRIPDNIYRSSRLGGFAFVPKWNTGFNVLYETSITPGHHTIDMVAFVGNGENLPQENENQFDSNSNKAVGGRGQFTSQNEALTVGLSVYDGDKAISEDNIAATHSTWLFSVDADFDSLNIHSEFGVSSLDDKKETAWYVQTSYRFGALTPYFRLQSIDPNDNIDDDYWTTMLSGINYMINDHLFLKVEWNEHRRGKNNGAILNEGDENYGELLSAVTLFF